MFRKFLFALMLGVATPLFAADSDAEVETAIHAAVEHIDAHGLEETVAAIHDPARTEFRPGGEYIFILDQQGVAIAHGGKPKLVGVDLHSVINPQTREAVLQPLFDAGGQPGERWVEYVFLNPETGAMETKRSFIHVTESGLMIGAGYYKGH